MRSIRTVLGMTTVADCPTCGLPEAVRAQVSGLGRRSMASRLTKLGYPTSEHAARRHLEDCTSLVVPTVTHKDKWVTDSDGLSVEDFTEEYEARADFRAEASVAGVLVPEGAVWKGSTATVKQRVVVTDEEGRPVINPETGQPETADVNRWHRFVPEKEEIPGIPDAEMTEFRSKILSFLPSQKRWAPPSQEDPLAYVVAPSDLQAGKPGTDEAIETFLGGVRKHKAEIDHLLDRGFNLTEVRNLNGGDICEGVANNYRNQSRITDFLVDQLDVGIDTRLAGVRILHQPDVYELWDHSVPSNHGESWVREGGKDPVTSYRDNIDIHVARQVRRLCSVDPSLKDVKFSIQEDGWADVFSILGHIKTYLTHAHSEQGTGSSTEARTQSAIERQILGDLPNLHDLQLAYAAHYHHDYHLEFRGISLHGLPACEAIWSSEYMRKKFGVWSNPGVTGMVVGDSMGPRKWGRLNIFGA